MNLPEVTIDILEKTRCDTLSAKFRVGHQTANPSSGQHLSANSQLSITDAQLTDDAPSRNSDPRLAQPVGRIFTNVASIPFRRVNLPRTKDQLL